MKNFDLSPMFSDEEFKHWFLPQEGIIDAYVVVNNNKITGIIVLILRGCHTCVSFICLTPKIFILDSNSLYLILQKIYLSNLQKIYLYFHIYYYFY